MKTPSIILTGLVSLALLAAAKETKASLAPLPAELKPVSVHAPFEADAKDCSQCHVNADPKAPGKVKKAGNALCLECHDDFVKVLKRKEVHAPVEDNCTNCHNPHNAAQPKLLIQELGALCVSCHDDQKTEMTKSKVVHGALATGKKCLNCHNPHASDIKHKLIKPAADLCLNCHSTDTITDAAGKKLINMKKWLDANPEQHAPVATQDCTACHKPHASSIFRLLTKEYPPQFYSTFATNLYALCFECHDPKMVSEPETTTLTQFRNGSKNLHYLHVNRTEHGRTCRACHDVHAAKLEHILREGVPYGPSGWILKLNYAKTPNGGSCTKTCHSVKIYDRIDPVKNEEKPQPEKLPAAPPPVEKPATTPPAPPPSETVTPGRSYPEMRKLSPPKNN